LVTYPTNVFIALFDLRHSAFFTLVAQRVEHLSVLKVAPNVVRSGRVEGSSQKASQTTAHSSFSILSYSAAAVSGSITRPV
jgi:hypothetical protein